MRRELEEGKVLLEYCCDKVRLDACCLTDLLREFTAEELSDVSKGLTIGKGALTVWASEIALRHL
jgi:hypothetical protein